MWITTGCRGSTAAEDCCEVEEAVACEAGVLEVVVPVDVVGWPGWVWLMLGGEVVGGDTDGLPLPMGSTSAMDTMMSLLMG